MGVRVRGWRRRLWPADAGRLYKRVVRRKVQRVQKVQWVQRVQRGRLTGPPAPRVLKVLRFDGPAARGLWIALRAMSIKSALRVLPLCHRWYMTKCYSRLSAAPLLRKGLSSPLRGAPSNRWQSCIGLPSQATLALSLHTKGLPF